jgi:hypothetical protein
MAQSINYEVICDKNMMLRFLDKYSGTAHNPIDLTEQKNEIPDKNISDNFYNVLTNVIRSGIWKNDTTIMNFDGKEYKIGSMLSVCYYPYSQKYIDYYNDERFVGVLIYADKEADNALFIVKKLPHIAFGEDEQIKTEMEIIDTMKELDESITVVKSLECNSSHFLGISRCYSYYVNEA